MTRLAAAALLAAVLARPAFAQTPLGPDTLRARFEIGAGTDVTNEQFYEDAFLDTVALGRRLVSDPETHVSGLLRSSLEGTRGDGATGYRASGEIAAGNKVQRGEASVDWRHDVSERWRWVVAPRAEWRKDRTFGRDLEEARATANGRLRWMLPDLTSGWELSGQGEWFRTHGVGADFLPDRNTGKLGVSFERSPLFGPEWELGAATTWRDFPDSTVRNHLEHRGEARWRRDLAGGAQLELEAEVSRRKTFDPAPTSRDNFWESDLSAEASRLVSASTSVWIRSSAELLRYDASDSTIFFDYDILRLQLGPQLVHGAWTARLGPRGELLRSPREPDEEYREIAGVLELEWIPATGWWSLTPVAGWRDYVHDEQATDALGTAATPSTRSSYAFYELDAMIDQALTGGTRLHVYASGRLERHTDRDQDARSLYFACELRRLF